MRRNDWDDLAAGHKGDWYFHHDETYITIRYGDDVMDVVSIPIVRGDQSGPAWGWDGDKEKPTITPSIAIRGREGQPDLWHGYLTDGKLVNA